MFINTLLTIQQNEGFYKQQNETNQGITKP